MTANNLFNEIHGLYGVEVVTDATTHTVSASAITFIGTTVIDTLGTDTQKGYSDSTLNGKTMTGGFTIYGNFTSLKLVSGSALMYKKHPVVG
jgi:hypothetical protein